MSIGFPAGEIDVDRLRDGAIEWSGELPSDAAAWGGGDLKLLGRPTLRYRAELAGSGGVRVLGTLAAVVGLECRRCLRALVQPVAVEFDLRFDPNVEPWDEREGVYAMDREDPILDLSRALREELRLAVPEYPECAGGCRCLCPRCGAELGDAPCDCAGDEPDPRWDVLRRLMPDGPSGERDRGDGENGEGE